MMGNKILFGSVCSGIEAASVALEPLGFSGSWFSEIADFPSKVLKKHYPNTPNLGDMVSIPTLITTGEIEAPDFFCGGTPCQAFSLAGWREGLSDDRGLLTIKFIEIANAIDQKRIEIGKKPALILWENVEGVLSDKTNAFGNFLGGLAGSDTAISYNKRWPSAGFLRGPQRNIAWRVLDAKYFGLPQQRRRLFVIAGDRYSRPEQILFESTSSSWDNSKKGCKINQNERTSGNNNENQLSLFESKIIKKKCLVFKKNGHEIELFREYTDCLYSAYGTKWNGNAAAYNGSLYVSQNGNLRRFTPLECERLMGFADNYTLIDGATDTTRYQAIGNSWAIPVISWLGARIKIYLDSYCLVS
jgi:DNA (cytosine-5)-methyltransferase 1